jgi:hypothetical protein
LITKQNHLTGVIEQIHLNPGRFHEQYHNFQSFGHAIDPSDVAGKKLIHSNFVNKVDLDANVENGTTKSRKAYRKELKKKRLRHDDASSGDF